MFKYLSEEFSVVTLLHDGIEDHPLWGAEHNPHESLWWRAPEGGFARRRIERFSTRGFSTPDPELGKYVKSIAGAAVFFGSDLLSREI